MTVETEAHGDFAETSKGPMAPPCRAPFAVEPPKEAGLKRSLTTPRNAFLRSLKYFLNADGSKCPIRMDRD